MAKLVGFVEADIIKNQGTVTDLVGATEATTVYCDNVLIARNATITLPEITRLCYTAKTALGEQDIPTNLLEDMETSISKVGIDVNMAKFSTPDTHKVEYRWVQMVTETTGETKRVGCKAILNTQPVTINPGGDIEAGSESEVDLTHKVLSYSLYIAGEEKIKVNKITGVLEINGRKYGVDESLL